MAGDRAHFENYREQTRVKHTIVEKYIVAYFHLLKGRHANLVYIDGFAGRGTYDDETTAPPTRVDGSPLRALKQLAARPELAEQVTTIFIEHDGALAQDLLADVQATHTAHPHLRKPQVCCGVFAEQLHQAMDNLESAGQRLAPTFLFVDPCGVAGASFAVLQRFFRQAHSEALIFFNLDAVRRILGLAEKMGTTLEDFLGSRERVEDLARRVSACDTVASREECIVSYYKELLRSTPAKYITVFRVEKEGRRATSHYLIHASQHPLGFMIMKDVMWTLGRTTEGAGGLALEQASLGKGGGLFRPRWEAIKTAVTKELEVGPRRVSHFYENLASHPDNSLSANAYRAALLELETTGAVEVLDKQGVGRAGKRRPGTLGKDYYVRLVAAQPPPPTAGSPSDDGDDIMVPGRCLQCDARTPLSTFSCLDCGEQGYSCSGEEVFEKDGCWYVIDHDPEASGNPQITCEECGSPNIDVEFESMCSGCAHFADAD